MTSSTLPRRYWFAGHGMLHGVRLRDGRAEWYRNALRHLPPALRRG